MRPLLLLLCLSASAQDSGDAQKVRSAELAAHYDAALKLYTAKDYSRAIMEYREVLRLDPGQANAKMMIELARQEIDKRDRERQQAVYDRAAEGRYQDALVALQPLLESDSLHPHYSLLQSRLERVSFIVPAASTDTKGWRAAVKGLTGYIARQDDLALAYDGLRLARELEPEDVLVGRLVAVLLADDPSLAQDALTPGMGVLEHRRYLALNLIYDGKYRQAAAILERVVALDPEDATALKRLGSARFALKDRARAKELWARALKLAPDDEQLKLFLSRVDLPD